MRKQLFLVTVLLVSFPFVVIGQETPKSVPATKILKQKVAQEKSQTEQEIATVEIAFADKGLKMLAPKSWESVEPSFSMIEVEFAVPKVDGDENNGRVTISTSGGPIEQNLDRWYGQFTQSDGQDTADVAKVEVKTINDMKVHLVDVSGSFIDRFKDPSKSNENYRMLAAIVETGSHGNYFIKCYGPANTIKANEAGFKKMMESVKEID